MSHTVRTTMNPHVEIEVSDAEYLDLRRQGLLAAGPPEPPPVRPERPPADKRESD